MDLDLWLFYQSDLYDALFRRWSGYSLMYNAHCTAVNVLYNQNGIHKCATFSEKQMCTGFVQVYTCLMVYVRYI